MKTTKMPKLSKLTATKEADWDGKVAQWFMKHWDRPVCIEVKVKGGKVYKHQISALKKTENEGGAFKLRDDGFRQPFDYIIFPTKSPPDAFIVWIDTNTRICTAKTAVGGITQFEFKV